MIITIIWNSYDEITLLTSAQKNVYIQRPPREKKLIYLFSKL